MTRLFKSIKAAANAATVLRVSFRNTLFLAGFSALLATQTLSAQNAKLVADIPFAFHAQGRVLPAGSYRLSEITRSGGVFQVFNTESTASQLLSAPIPRTSYPRESKITFARYGNDYVLTEISVAGTDHTHAVSQSAVEKNITRRLGLSAMISVPLRAR